ncbi:MAG: cytosine permease [Desulfobacterales bacterium]|nr:cytosine permease [Desulfobacterales bacterium]
MSEEAKEYPVDEAVPMEERHYGFWDMAATWLGANACTGSWYTGGVLAALGIGGTLTILLVANPIAYFVMALIGYMGYKVGTTTMGLTRASFGIKGSILPSFFNTTQFIGWCAVNTFIAAISLSFLFAELWGWPAFGEEGSWWSLGLGVLICSILQIGITVVAGSRSIKYAERVAATLLIVLTIWETVVIFNYWSFEQIINWRPPADLSLPFGNALDMMAAFSLGWVPAIAEFTRYAKTKGASTGAPVIGANISLFWFTLVGALGAIAATLISGQYDPNTSDPSSIMGTLGLGWVAFLVLVLATVTTNSINIYAAGMSAINIWPRVKPFRALWIVSILALIVSFVPIIVGSFLDSFIFFLDYIGAVFAPLFAIIVVDYYFLRNQKYDWKQASRKGGIYWYSNGINWKAMIPWIFGTILCLVLKSSAAFGATVGGIYPTIVVTTIIYYAINKMSNVPNDEMVT